MVLSKSKNPCLILSQLNFTLKRTSLCESSNLSNFLGDSTLMFHFCFFNYKISGSLNYLVKLFRNLDFYGTSLSEKKAYYRSNYIFPVLIDPITGDFCLILR